MVKKIISIILCIAAVFLICFALIHSTNNDEAVVVEKSSHADEIIQIEKEPEKIPEKEDVQPVFPSEKTEEPEETTRSFKMTVLGDVLCHNTQYWDAWDAEKQDYDFSYSFEHVKQSVEAADITVAQLETNFAGGPNYSNYPLFNTPEGMARDLAELGVDVLTMAGNHALDHGFTGLVSTLDFIHDAGIDTVGVYASQEERDYNNGVLLKNINGIKVAFISYTYGTNGIPLPSDKEFAVNILYEDYMSNFSVIRKEALLADINAAKEQDADLIIGCMHWGNEYFTKQNDHQEELASFLFENGVDVILGGHPHVLEPMEKRTVTTTDGETKDVFVCFSLGNFVSSQVAQYTNDSVILDLEFTMDLKTRKVSVTDVSYTPICMLLGSQTPNSRYYVVDIYKAIAEYESGDYSHVGDTAYSKITQALDDIHMILGTEFDKNVNPQQIAENSSTSIESGG